MKKVILGFLGVLLTTNLFAIEDRNYRCISVGIKSGDLMIKIPKEDMSIVDISVAHNSISNGSTTYEWIGYYKNMSLYAHKGKGTIGIPSKKIKGIIPLYFSKANDGRNILIFGCKKQ